MSNKFKRNLILWSKTDLCVCLGCSLDQLDLIISEECKKEVNWKKGQQRFRDKQILMILLDLFPAKSDAERREMIGYKPIQVLDFA